MISATHTTGPRNQDQGTDGRTRTEEIKGGAAATQKGGRMRCPEHEIYEGADKTCDDDTQIPTSMDNLESYAEYVKISTKY